MRRDSGRKFLGVDAPSFAFREAKEMHSEHKERLDYFFEGLRGNFSYLINQCDRIVQQYKNDGGEIFDSDEGTVYTFNDVTLTCYRDDNGRIFRHTFTHPASKIEDSKRVIEAAHAYEFYAFYRQEIKLLEDLIGRFQNFSPERGCEAL